MGAVHPGGVGVDVGFEVGGVGPGELGEVAARDVRGDARAGGEDAPIEGGYEDLRAEAVGFDDFGDGFYLLIWWGAELGCLWVGLAFFCAFPFPLASLPSTTRRSRSAPWLPCRVQLGAASLPAECSLVLQFPLSFPAEYNSALPLRGVRFDFDVDEEVRVVLRPVAKFFEGGDGDLVELSLVGKALLVVAAWAQGADVVAF